MTAHKRWAGEPERCTCTRIVVDTLEETMACPYGWRLVPGTGWVHSWPPRRRGASVVIGRYEIRDGVR